MRWFFRSLLVTIILISAYMAWPFYGLYQLAHALQTRDVARINQLVEFPALRRSLSSQIIATYLTLTGQSSRMGPLGTTIATGVGATLADPEVEKIVSAEGLLALLEKGQVGTLPPATTVPSPRIEIRTLFKMWADADYGGSRVFFFVPPDAPAKQQFRLRLQLIDWQWKLTAIELPEDLRTTLAQELVRRTPKPN